MKYSIYHSAMVNNNRASDQIHTKCLSKTVGCDMQYAMSKQPTLTCPLARSTALLPGKPQAAYKHTYHPGMSGTT